MPLKKQNSRSKREDNIKELTPSKMVHKDGYDIYKAAKTHFKQRDYPRRDNLTSMLINMQLEYHDRGEDATKALKKLLVNNKTFTAEESEETIKKLQQVGLIAKGKPKEIVSYKNLKDVDFHHKKLKKYLKRVWNTDSEKFTHNYVVLGRKDLSSSDMKKLWEWGLIRAAYSRSIIIGTSPFIELDLYGGDGKNDQDNKIPSNVFLTALLDYFYEHNQDIMPEYITPRYIDIARSLTQPILIKDSQGRGMIIKHSAEGVNTISEAMATIDTHKLAKIVGVPNPKNTATVIDRDALFTELVDNDVIVIQSLVPKVKSLRSKRKRMTKEEIKELAPQVYDTILFETLAQAGDRHADNYLLQKRSPDKYYIHTIDYTRFVPSSSIRNVKREDVVDKFFSQSLKEIDKKAILEATEEELEELWSLRDKILPKIRHAKSYYRGTQDSEKTLETIEKQIDHLKKKKSD